jgi:alanine-alpha-ketoisovalerate/valine-pyruvate aminotransferase
MSAFPTTGTNALRDNRNNLRLEIARLQAIVALADDWVEALERDRIALVGAGKPYADDAAFDAAFNTIASNLLTNLRAETSTTSTAGLNLRIKNTLTILG